MTSYVFIGLGAMGVRMAHRLVAARCRPDGSQLLVWNRTPSRAQALPPGWYSIADSAGDVMAQADVIVTMLPDLPELVALVEGPQRLLDRVDTPTVLVVGSTVGPQQVRLFAADVRDGTGGLVTVMDARNGSVIAITVALFLLSWLIAPGSVSSIAIDSMLPFASILAIAAIGQTIVIMLRGIDLSLPGMMTLAARAATLPPITSIASLHRGVPIDEPIVAVSASEGQSVKIGDVLLVMEAMMMENPILARISGTVTSLSALVGQVVLAGSALATIEPDPAQRPEPVRGLPSPGPVGSGCPPGASGC